MGTPARIVLNLRNRDQIYKDHNVYKVEKDDHRIMNEKHTESDQDNEDWCTQGKIPRRSVRFRGFVLLASTAIF